MYSLQDAEQEVCEHCTQSSELLGPNREITHHRNTQSSELLGPNREITYHKNSLNRKSGANQQLQGNNMDPNYCPVHSPGTVPNINSQNLYSPISVKQDKPKGFLLKPGNQEIYATIQPRIRSSSPQDPDLVPCKAGSFIMDTFLHSPTTTSGTMQSPSTTGNVQDNSCSAAASVPITTAGVSLPPASVPTTTAGVSLSTASVQKGNHKHNVLHDSPDHGTL